MVTYTHADRQTIGREMISNYVELSYCMDSIGHMVTDIYYFVEQFGVLHMLFLLRVVPKWAEI